MMLNHYVIGYSMLGTTTMDEQHSVKTKGL